jgi:hypothetical protein
MANKIRIVGDFGEEVVDKVQQLIEGLSGVQTTQVLVAGQDVFPHPDEEAHAAEHAPADQQPGAPAEGTGDAAAPEGEAPPTGTWDGTERRQGTADRRTEDVTA